MLAHADDLRRINQRYAGRMSLAVFGDLALDLVPGSNQNDLVGTGQRVVDGATHHLARCEVPAHRVDRDAHFRYPPSEDVLVSAAPLPARPP